MKIKKIIPLFILILWSASTCAASKVTCQVVHGQYPNSMLQAKEISFESSSDDDFWLMSANRLNINIFGTSEAFIMKATSVCGGSLLGNGGTKMDYVLASNEAVKAVVLLDRTPGKAGRKKLFKGIIVITNTNVNLTMEGGSPLLSQRSLVYNIKCKW